MSTTPLHIVIPGEPVAQGRPRTRVVRSKAGQMRALVYDPAKSRNWKATAQAHMRQALGNQPPLPGPVKLGVTCYFTCPRSQWRTRSPRQLRWHTKTPDLDNCLKIVQDAGKGVLWLDDSQVAHCTVAKFIAAQGQPPCVLVELWELELPPGQQGFAQVG